MVNIVPTSILRRTTAADTSTFHPIQLVRVPTFEQPYEQIKNTILTAVERLFLNTSRELVILSWKSRTTILSLKFHDRLQVLSNKACLFSCPSRGTLMRIAYSGRFWLCICRSRLVMEDERPWLRIRKSRLVTDHCRNFYKGHRISFEHRNALCMRTEDTQTFKPVADEQLRCVLKGE